MDYYRQTEIRVFYTYILTKGKKDVQILSNNKKSRVLIEKSNNNMQKEL